jgi:hypothetical protein
MYSDDESNINLSHSSSSEDNDGDGNNANFRGPWFTVVDPHSFVVARLPTFIADSGPVDCQPNMTPFEYFKRFTNTDDEDIFDELVDETSRYAASALNARRRVTPHAREKQLETRHQSRNDVIFWLGVCSGEC